MDTEKVNINVHVDTLKYILHCFLFDITKLIDLVLDDSEEDPQYSAVTANNEIKCYIQIMQDIGAEIDYKDVKGFFKDASYTEEEYQLFEKKRAKESEYYIGYQF